MPFTTSSRARLLFAETRFSGRSSPESPVTQPLCTVLIPFDAGGKVRFDVLQPLGEKLGFQTLRVAQYYSSGMIQEEVVRSIRDASLVIADLTGANPNVYYELGIAHALGKRVFITAESLDTIAIDSGKLHACKFNNTTAGLDILATELQRFVQIPGCLSPIDLFTGGSSVIGQRLILRRIGAFLVDLVTLAIPTALLTIALPEGLPVPEWLPGTLLFACFIGYFFLTTVFFGASPGQRLLGLKVIRLDRSRPSAWQSLFRPLASILTLFTLGIALLWSAKPPRYQTVHDNLTRTLVVKASRFAGADLSPH